MARSVCWNRSALHLSFSQDELPRKCVSILDAGGQQMQQLLTGMPINTVTEHIVVKSTGCSFRAVCLLRCVRSSPHWSQRVTLNTRIMTYQMSTYFQDRKGFMNADSRAPLAESRIRSGSVLPVAICYSCYSYVDSPVIDRQALRTTYICKEAHRRVTR